MDGTRLILTLPDREPVAITPAEKMSFGRSDGPLQILHDGRVDPGMSRTVAQVSFHNGWWIHNPADDDPRVRRRQAVHVADIDGGAIAIVEPDGQCQLPPHGTVRFRTALAHYEIGFRVEGATPPTRPTFPAGETPTVRPHLFPREVDYLVTLAKPELAGTRTDPRPTFDWVAERWGVGRRTVEESTRRARARMETDGYVNLGPKLGAPDLTDRFVRWLVDDVRLLRAQDWQWAFGDGLPPRPASDGPRFSNRVSDTGDNLQD